ncbi:MAG TPA: hypothetical protein VHG08_01050 [Longimicrobium sp.]|nr:hypothetical protein [Longimicrobium sp.]
MALAAGACGDTAPTGPLARPDDAPPSLLTLISTAAATSGPNALDHTNGNKAVTGPGGVMHVVYAEGGSIKYTRSSNALSWSPPVVIATGAASQPTIAVTSTGLVGVAYQRLVSGFYRVYYTHRPDGGAWQPAVQIADHIDGYPFRPAPSLVQFRGEMHLAFSTGSYVRYFRFPPALTTPPAFSDVEIANIILLCGDPYYVGSPSIAVAARGPGSTDPLVRVAFFWITYGGSCSDFGAGLTVLERPEHNPAGMPWDPPVWTFHEFAPPPTGTEGVSLSMAANPETGSFYLAFSKLVGGVGETRLAHMNAWTGTSAQAVLLPREAQVHVAATGCGFRLALADYTLGTGGYGPTWHRTGRWKAAGLAWDGPEAPVSALGRSPQAIAWERFGGGPKGNRLTSVHAFFDESAASGYAVAHDRETVLLRQLPPVEVCSSPITPAS